MDVNGNNLLMMAASSSNDTSSTIIFLIQQGMDINTINSMNGDTSLSLAVKGGFIGNVKTLIDLGANMNIQAENGKTVFDQTQDPQILGLLRANADLLQASSTGNLSQMQLSLSKGASLNVRDANGQTPLMRSCTKGAHQFISLLMGDTINAQDYDGNTALHMAARSGYSLVVKTLLENKADKKIKNLNQETPLSLAIKHIHPYSIELLSFR
jgi:ankyrin repeat protein